MDAKHAISIIDPFASRGLSMAGTGLISLPDFSGRAGTTTVGVSVSHKSKKSDSSSDSDDDSNATSNAFGFAKFNLVPGVTGVTGVTGTTGPLQLFGFTGSNVNNCVAHLDLSGLTPPGSTVIIDRGGYYTATYQYTLVNDPSYLSDLFFYTGLLVNGQLEMSTRRYEHMIAANGAFPGISNPTSISITDYLPAGTRINMYFEANGAMPITLKSNASAILNLHYIRTA